MQTLSFYLRVALNHCGTVPETFGIQNFHSEQQQKHIFYQLFLFCTAFLPIRIERAKNKILANSLLQWAHALKPKFIHFRQSIVIFFPYSLSPLFLSF